MPNNAQLSKINPARTSASQGPSSMLKQSGTVGASMK